MRQLLDDLRWALLMLHLRRYRRQLSFSSRRRLDEVLLRPTPDGKQTFVDYPDAFYEMTPADLERATRGSVRR